MKSQPPRMAMMNIPFRLLASVPQPDDGWPNDSRFPAEARPRASQSRTDQSLPRQESQGQPAAKQVTAATIGKSR